ncbi:SusD/RagB family nutrient-binding outer membrane lipoprotein [Sphingobacterium bovistauri]|uniref:SusD/RagB family nutrient-binding outer membrane lipoprotein n=1 Tax=Sphingobacterium bovistauri TaxID=2781959 RepID=A0ABS7Z9U5_9SPHI|nr:SusD/RagB family nutrient-binding outer membrane lipoprotein [Sphingobacterium bovistauri]MCA5005709.1 SusD/RagB family nutrient-binding outer membrane lipoprotein [Sphingobacterium bovistauri]
MKNRTLKNSLGLISLGVSLIFNSCENYLDVNTDPNNPAKVEAASRIAGAITTSSGASQWRGTRELAAVMQYGGLQSASSGGYAAANWRFTASYFLWQNAYVNTMPNSVDLIRLGEEEGNLHFVGVGKTILALNFGLLTSQYGDIVFDDYYDGKNQIALTPKFNTQKEVYEKIQVLLDEAIVAFDNTTNNRPLNIKNGDLLYQGDVSKWKKFAWSLKARYYNHLSKKSSLYNADKVIEACSKGFDGDGMDAEFAYLSGGLLVDENPWSSWGGFESTTNPRYFAWTQFFVNMLTSFPVSNTLYDDPRVSKIMKPAASDGKYRGPGSGNFITNGQGVLADGSAGDATKTSPNDYGRFSKSGYYTNTTSPFGFITYSEVKFIEAEARLRKGDKSGAKVAFEEGVKANMRKLGVSGSEITAYWVSQKADGFDTKFEASLNNGLSYILRQKYISLCLNPETWNDMRRMDYSAAIYGPSLKRPKYLNTTVFDENNPNQWIQAMVYETNEQTRNPDAVGDNSEKSRLLTPTWINTAE